MTHSSRLHPDAAREPAARRPAKPADAPAMLLDPMDDSPRQVAQRLTMQLSFGGHARQRLSPLAGPVSARVVQRALRGSHEALLAVKAAMGFRFGKTHGRWTDLLEAVAEYEQVEAEAAPTGNIKKHKKYAGRLKDGLDAIEKAGKSWLTAHEADTHALPGVAAAVGTGDLSGVADPDRKEVEVMTAIRNLLRRVAWERAEISVQTPHTPVRADTTLDPQRPAQDDAVGGQASRLDRVFFPGQQGFYQADSVRAPVQDSAAGAIGIPGVDPNWTGRSLAAARLDRLITARFNAVTAGAAQPTSLVPMEPATHSRTPLGAQQATATAGLYLEEAKGREMRGQVLDAGEAVVDENARTSATQMALDDPVLQRALNRLQLLDAICGQVDRHMGNLYVTQNAQGQVTGVQGIDNDMAFGMKLKGDDLGLRAPAKPGVATDLIGEQRAWVGLPPVADAEVALAIQNIAPDDIRQALAGLISTAEIDATVARLEKTQAFLGGLPANALVAPADWNARKTELAGKQNVHDSLLGTARTEARGVVTNPMAVTTRLSAAMEQQRPTRANERVLQGRVPEWVLGEKAILQDVKNLVGKGLTQVLAVQRGEVLARQYAQRVAFPDGDRSALTLRQATETMDGAQCAAALESARRVCHALWG